MWDYLKQASKPIVLYGMGNGADKVLDRCNTLGITVSGVFASDSFARHNMFRGYRVSTYGEAKARFGEMIVLVCFGSARPDVISNVRLIETEQELLIPDMPVYGTGYFDNNRYSERKREYARLSKRLSDDLSVETLNSLIQYRLTGKYGYLRQCESDREEIYRNILMLSGKEHFLDLGAYKGDTIRSFLRRTGEYAAITAVEPDRSNYAKLCAAAAGLPNCRCFHAAAWSRSGTVLFETRKGRNSSAGVSGTELQSIACDDINTEPPFSLIDIDVEGSEIQAIEGLKESIQHDKPKMAIAAYHRVDDYLDIPKLVLSIRKDYAVYLRHFPGFPAWDTYFYFV